MNFEILTKEQSEMPTLSQISQIFLTNWEVLCTSWYSILPQEFIRSRWLRKTKEGRILTPGGHYEYKRMPMGLKNAPATFQRLIEHDKKVRQFFSRLAQTNLALQPDKVHFLRKEVAFIRHIVSERGFEPDPEKSRLLKNFRTQVGYEM